MRYTTKESFLPPLWIISLIVIALTFWLVMQLKELVVLLVVGYFIAYALDPILDKLEKKGIGRPFGFMLACVILMALAAVLVITAIPTIGREYEKLSVNFANYVAFSKEKIIPLLQWGMEKLGISGEDGLSANNLADKAAGWASYVDMGALNKVLVAVFGTLLQGYSITLTLVNLALLPFIVYYLAVDFNAMHRMALDLVPIIKRNKVSQLFQEVDSYVSAFIRGQLKVCTILFILYAIGLSSVGVELWLLLAVITGFGNMIPYLGFAIGICLSSLMALVTFGDFYHVFLVWGVFALVQFLEGTFITPKIVGDSVGLSPLVVILALFAGGQLLGLLGIFLAIPISAAFRVFLKHSYRWALQRR